STAPPERLAHVLALYDGPNEPGGRTTSQGRLRRAGPAGGTGRGEAGRSAGRGLAGRRHRCAPAVGAAVAGPARELRPHPGRDEPGGGGGDPRTAGGLRERAGVSSGLEAMGIGGRAWIPPVVVVHRRRDGSHRLRRVRRRGGDVVRSNGPGGA